MKKMLALVSLLMLAGACSGPSTNQPLNANMTPGAKAPARMIEDETAAREKAVWDVIKNKDYEAFGNMLASDYIEVEDAGVYDKAGIVSYVKDLSLSDVTFSDWKVVSIDKDAVLVRYSVNVKGTYKGEAFPVGPYRASSAWVNRAGKWLAIYYQETEAKPPSPAPTSSKSPTKAMATPASSSSAAATVADAEANEKMVWEALKKKDYDAFAAFLAPDFIQVEADGVYDKAGSVNGVSGSDLSKAELSEWKTVKFDNDSSLVTYMVKLPGPHGDQERHTTIWVNRGGKWLALFHQGTPVAKPGAMPASAATPATTKMKM